MSNNFKSKDDELKLLHENAVILFEQLGKNRKERKKSDCEKLIKKANSLFSDYCLSVPRYLDCEYGLISIQTIQRFVSKNSLTDEKLEVIKFYVKSEYESVRVNAVLLLHQLINVVSVNTPQKKVFDSLVGVLKNDKSSSVRKNVDLTLCKK